MSKVIDRAGDEDVIAVESVTPTRTVEFKKVGETSLLLHIFSPDDLKANEFRPAVVFFHGGAWMKGSPTQFYWQCEHLKSLGIVAITAQYRLKPQVNVKQCIHDAKSAVRWVRQHASELHIDTDRIVGSGGSAGGHLAACTAALNEEESGEDLSISSKSNLLFLFNPALFSPKGENTLSLEMLTKDLPPTALIYGTQDKMISYGADLLARSKKEGNIVKLYSVEDAGHGFFNKSPFREETMFLMDQFLMEHGYLKKMPESRPASTGKIKQVEG
jgi:acetyl esterase